MATLVDEIGAILNPPALVPGGIPPLPRAEPAGSTSFVDEIGAILNPAPVPEPQPTNMPGVGSGVLAITNWIKQNPQAVLDMVMQGGGTGLGIAGGALTSPVTGPAGPIVGGAAGNVAGKQLSRRVGQALDFPDAQAPPDLNSIETAIDAGLGAAGPVVTSAARPIARVLTGASPKVVGEQAGRFAERTEALALGRAVDLRGAIARPESRTTFDEMGRALQETAQNASAQITRTAAETAENAAQRVSGNIQQLTNFGAIGSAFATGDLTTAAAILGGGHALSAVQRKAATSLMQNEKFVGWLNKAAPSSRAQFSGSLGAILAEQQLTPAERADITTLRGIGQRRDASGATYDANVDRHRTPDGRFHGAPIRHGERPDGTHPDDDDAQ